MPEIAAIILAGGESRRMGRPKADLPFGGETLLQRAVRLLSPAASSVIVSAAPNQRMIDLPARVILARDPAPGLGPLQGLASGLAAVPTTADLAYLTSVDAPFFVPAWLDLLTERIAGCDAAHAVVDGLFRPMPALFRITAVKAAADSLLASGDRRLSSALRSVKSNSIPEQDLRLIDPDFRAFLNVNTPDEYRYALSLLTGEPANPAIGRDFVGRPRGPNV